MRHVAVIDIGKTNVKAALVDLDALAEVAVETQPNPVLPGPPWPHFDTGAQWRFLAGALRRLAREARIEGIVVTTHGACAALLAADGSLAAPVLDYEHRGPEALRPAYEALRPPFSTTGSPALPMGLNLGAQLHWMLAQDAGLAARVAHVVTWPQFWGHRLTGEVACDLCSLGCHTDLWEPEAGRWSDLPARLGLAGRMAPPGRPGEVLGMLAPEAQAATGIGPVPVLVGIHDSNASLLPHLAAREPPFAVVSTGTWVIAMAVGGAPVTLDPARDTLVNVSAFGAPVPSARFMGGREHEMLLGPSPPEASEAEAAAVLARGVMLLPSVIPDSGPFQGRTARWTAEPQGADRSVAAGYYLGLMAAECLAQIGATGPSVVEGPLAANRWFRAMLATATGRAVEASEARTGTAVGAALLFAPAQARTRGAVTLPEPALQGYARAWRALAG